MPTDVHGYVSHVRHLFLLQRAFFSKASRNVYQLHMVKGVETVFPQLPVTVNISFVVDGQAMANTDSADRGNSAADCSRPNHKLLSSDAACH